MTGKQKAAVRFELPLPFSLAPRGIERRISQDLVINLSFNLHLYSGSDRVSRGNCVPPLSYASHRISTGRQP